MIHIYIGEENLPKGMKLIDDPESVFLMVKMVGTSFQKALINEVDKGVYKDSKCFIDRFGVQLYHTALSTGTKTMLELEAFPDRVIRCDEVGNNALKYMTRLNDCNLYFPYRDYNLSWEEDIPVIVNGAYCEHISLLTGEF